MNRYKKEALSQFVLNMIVEEINSMINNIKSMPQDKNKDRWQIDILELLKDKFI